MSLPGVIPDDVWAGWVQRAIEINEYKAPDHPPVGRRPPPAGPAGGDAPGSDFNRRGSWEEAGLLAAGWAWVRAAGDDRGLLCRPGKERGVSASAGMVTSKESGWPLFYCWSTSVPEFVPEEPYTRFAVFAILRHGGDFGAAAKELAARGYGRRAGVDAGPVFGEVPPGSDRPTGADAARPFKWMSELERIEANDKWIWEGFLSRGGVSLLSALWKAGKSTLLSHLLKALDGRATEFLGKPLVPARVLYVSEELETDWADRRDALGIGDHVGMICRPFKGRASPAEWAAWLTRLVQVVQDFRFDVVVLDTISKMWPVREENDAGQVEDALVPLWKVADAGAAVLLVHHNRKSDGKDFTGMRGSGGLPAFCETLIEFRRHSEDSRDAKRVLTCGGRYKETPPKWLIELTTAGYVAHGDPDDPAVRAKVGDPVTDWRKLVPGLLPDKDPGIPLKEIRARLGEHSPRRVDLEAWLDDRVEDGELVVMGKGTRGSPHRWRRVGFASDPCEMGRDTNPDTNPDGDSDGD